VAAQFSRDPAELRAELDATRSALERERFIEQTTRELAERDPQIRLH
jgi:hypothetical protein